VFIDLTAAVAAMAEIDSKYDSDNSTGSTAFRSSAAIPESLVSDDPTYERGNKGIRFLVVDHTANVRNRSKISNIWFHGGERRRSDERLQLQQQG
jgi:hypothetical protein